MAVASVTPSPTATPTPTPVVSIDSDKVSRVLRKVSRSGIKLSGVAVVSATGESVTGRNAGRPLAPASTLKLLTTIAAADLLGPDRTFTTTVVSPADDELILVGGGDPYLTDKKSSKKAKPASLASLAKQTVTALKQSGVKRVRLGYDASLFSGATLSPAWDRKWRGFVSRVTPLAIGEGLFNPWKADPKPAQTATSAFAKRLRTAGIKVTIDGQQKAPADATQLAAVESAPISEIIKRTLRLSDNFAAEVLARQVAIAAGQPGSFTGATAALQGWLVDHQLWDEGMKLFDGSGLAKKNRVTPRVLAQTVALALNTPEFAAVISGLPVAGKTGTLEFRFNDPAERAGRGNVHAKTGTLPGIGALAGYLTTADGTRLVFAEIANKAQGQTTTHNWLDRSAAALVRCHCNL